MTAIDFAVLAERATEKALANMRDGIDASAELSLAVAAWNVVMGDGPNDDLDDYVLTDDGYEIHRACICPPDLLARGGFRGGCPSHAGGGCS